MRYCFNCNHLTPGEPIYCEHCGRSYNVKLCPRQHRNPRTADVCSRCGSRDLSTPQPRVPWWVPLVEFLLTFIPGAVLTLISVTFAYLLLVAVLRDPRMISTLILLAIPLGTLWWLWSEIPPTLRTWISRLLRHRREGGERKENP